MQQLSQDFEVVSSPFHLEVGLCSQEGGFTNNTDFRNLLFIVQREIKFSTSENNATTNQIHDWEDLKYI